MPLDWRIQFSTTTVTEIPAAYPGGPSHPAGSTIVVVSLVQPSEGPPIAFPAPSAAALALGAATRAAKTAAAIKREFRFAAAPGENVRRLEGAATSQLFDYFEHCFVAVVFSVQSLEAYCNYKIALNLKGKVKVERRGELVELSAEEAERQLSTDEKLGTTLPGLLGVESPRGRSEWEPYVRLRRLRDATVHMKSHHQWTLASRNFDESPYSWFVQESPLQIPLPAIRMLRRFAIEHERAWLDNAQQLLEA